jgi:gliding motility-associated-like protein
VWVSGITTEANICLVNMSNSKNGNDFGIDDISITKCVCDIGVDAGLGGSICKGDSLQLSGTGATGYFWAPTNSLSCFTCDNPVAAPQQTTTYTVTVMGPSNCTVYDSVVVEVFPTLDLLAGPDTALCPGEIVQLTSSGIVDYQWLPTTGLSDPNIPNPVASPTGDITYFLFGHDEHGCDQSDSMHIDIFPQPQPPQASGDTFLCKFSPAPLHVDGEGSYQWTPDSFLSCDDCSDPLSIPDSTITYVVSVIDPNGCYAGLDSVTIEVDTTCDITIPPGAFLPTAFSPNNDGMNDYFSVLGNSITSFHMDIYNRWGTLIFSSNDKSIGWDGTFSGQKQEVGVYVWRMIAELTDGTHILQNGNVTLVR